MTVEEAAYRLRSAFTMCEFKDAYGEPIDSDIYYDAMNMAISALEKQIPKKPNKIQSKNSEDLWNLYCPSCENWIGMWNSRLKLGDMHNISNGKICPYCGQAIDWEGE